ncbi:DUF6678 family protein [Paenibacillus rubinfantis]
MISDRNLTSIMNDTMWKELQYSVHHELLFPPISSEVLYG